MKTLVEAQYIQLHKNSFFALSANQITESK